MKELKRLTSLLLALLLLSVIPTLAEDASTEARMVYTFIEGGVLPSWNQWKPLLELAGIESRIASGKVDAVYAGETLLSLFFSSELADNLEAFGCSAVEGGTPGPGECMISAYYAEEADLHPGDALNIADDAGRNAELTISGIYQPDPTYYDTPEGLAYIVLVPEDALLEMLDPDLTNNYRVDAVLLDDEALVEDFLLEANELMEETSVTLLSSAEMLALYSDRSTPAAEGEQLVTGFAGTDLYGEALPDEILVPGGVTMVNCWATFCNPCIAEMPGLKLLSEEYAAADIPFRIVGVCMDVTDFSGRIYDDLVETGRLIVEQTGADYLHIIPDTQMFKELAGKVNAYPTTFFLNDAGEVLGMYVGSRDEADWRIIINQYLPE